MVVGGGWSRYNDEEEVSEGVASGPLVGIEVTKRDSETEIRLHFQRLACH